MRIFTPSTNLSLPKSFVFFLAVVLSLYSSGCYAQVTKYWRGTPSSDSWNIASNWEPVGVPGPSDHVVIGDMGIDNNTSDPVIDDWLDYTIGSLTVGKDKAIKFYMAPRSIRVTGDVLIGKYGEIENQGTQSYYSGNFTVETGGIYFEKAFSENMGKGNGNKVWPVTEFLGNGKVITGLTVAAKGRGFNTLKITGSVTLGSALNITKADVVRRNGTAAVTEPPKLYVTGTFNPGSNQVKFDGSAVDGAIFEIAQSGTAYVNTTNFSGNYASVTTGATMFPTLLNALGTIHYAGTSNQNIYPSVQYGILRISGSNSVKTLSAPGVVPTTIASNLFVDAGILDLVSYSLNRPATSVTGGTMNVANGATLKLSASNFPSGFTTVDLGPTSITEYYGTAQTIADVTKGYGNLHLTGSGVKSMPSATTLIIAGNLVGSGSATFTAASNMAIAGKVDLSSSASFNGGTYIHTIGGDWINNANFTGAGSTVIMTGTGKKIERTVAPDTNIKNEFNNLQIAGLGTTISISNFNLDINGNLATTGAGTLTQASGSLTMAGGTSGMPTTISGAGIILNNLTINGFVSTGASFYVNGNFATNAGKAFEATTGTIVIGNTNRSTTYNITNNGNTRFFALNVGRLATDNPITTASSFSIASDLSGNNLQATAGTITFDGTSTFGGTHKLNDVAITGTLLRMATNATMSIAGTFADTGSKFDAASNVPNIVIYNGLAQNIYNTTYYNLQLSTNGGAITKTAAGALTALGDVTIDPNVTLAAGNYTHTLHGNWLNYGTLSAGTGTFVFAGAANTTVEGVTTFNVIRILKSDASNFLTITDDITTTDLYLTTGFMKTGASKRIIMLGERYNNGWVEGTITRIKAGGFAAATEYLFNGPYVSVNFGTITSQVTEVSVTSTPSIVTFSGAIPVNRLYRVQTNGSYTKAKLRLQYEDSELNGNTERSDEDGLKISNSDSYPVGVSWSVADKKANDYQANWVEDNGVTTGNPDGYTNLNKYWALSDKPNRYIWTGTVSTAWENKDNWYRLQVDGVTQEAATSAPTPSDIVELGTAAHTHEPVIGSEVYVKGLQFKPDYNIELTIGSVLYNPLITAAPSLTVKGNLTPVGTASQAHTINTGSQKLEVKSRLQMDNDQHKININKADGEIIVLGTLNQNSASLNIGAGNLRLKGDYAKTGGTFTTNSGSVTYEGGNAQVVADVSYYNLTVNKTSGVALYDTDVNPTIAGNLTVKAGTLLMQPSEETLGVVTISKNVVIGNIDAASNITTQGFLNTTDTNLEVKGNWTRVAGNFVPGTGSVTFAGMNAQTISSSQFNNLIFGNTATITGDIIVNGDVTLQTGTLSLGAYTLNRSAVGGTLTLATGTTLNVAGADNFPANYGTNTIDAGSTVIYSGAIVQNVKALNYGTLVFTGGGNDYPKSLAGTTQVQRDLIVETGATLDGNGKTLRLSGNFNKNGEFVAGSNYAEGTLVLAAANPIGQKQLQGTLTVHNLLLESGADYLLTGDLNIKGDFDNKGSINGYNRKVIFEGNFINDAILKSSGTASFKGERQQTIKLQAPIQPAYTNPATGGPVPPTVEFNGTVPPVLNSTAAPQFGSVVITNTGGVTPSVNWTVGGVLTVASGAKFHGGSYTHSFYTGISNDGTITSSGLLNFNPINQGITSQLPTNPYYPLKFGTNGVAFQSSGTLRIGGTEPIALLGAIPSSLNNLIIANTNVAGVKGYAIDKTQLPLLGAGWNITGNLTINMGSSLKGGSNLVYNPVTGDSLKINYSIGGELINNGMLAAGRATFTFKGTDSKITGTGTTMLGNVTVDTNSKLTVSKSLNIYGNLTHKGTDFITGEYPVAFIGAYPSVISTEPKLPLALSNLVVSKDDQTTAVTLETDLNKVLQVTAQKGVLDLKTNNVVAYPDIVADGVTTLVTTNLIALDGATIKVGGTSTLPVADSTSLAPTSTVEYYGTNQQVKSVQYGNLTLNNIGAATFESGHAKIAGNFIIAGETGQTIATPATVEYNGPGNQTVAALPYENLTLSTGGTKTFAAKHTKGVNRILSISGVATKDETVVVDADGTDVHVDYNGTVDQSVLPANYYNLTLSSTGVKSFSGTTGVEKDFAAISPAIADLTTNSSTLNFNGAVAQTIPGLSYHTIQISGGSDKSLVGSINVAQDIIMTNGKLLTGSNKITLSSTGNVVGEDNTNYITGTVETNRNVTASGTSGTSTNTAQSTIPMGVAAVAETFGNIGLAMTPVVGEPGNVKVTRVTGTAAAVGNGMNVSRYFQIEPTIASSNNRVDITMSYLNHELKPEMTGEAQKDLLFYWSDKNTTDASWRIIESSDAASAESSKQISATNVGQSGYFTLGRRVTPLPVELLSFTAKKNGNNAELRWSTASEKNNAGFEVQVSTDGYTYKQIGFVVSKVGSSSIKQEYNFTDSRNGKNGTRYYRLKQIDLDGASKLYGPKTIDFGVIVKATPAEVYPNPFNDKLNVSFSTPEAGVATIKLYTSTGKLLKTLTLQVQAGLNDNPLPMAQATYEPGLYLLVIELNGQQQTIKLMKE